MRRLVPAVFAVLLTGSGALRAQEASLSLGGTRYASPRDSTFAWRFEYAHDLGDWLRGSLAYVNEGHVPEHHRDGVAAQLWLKTPSWANLSLAVGAGPYQSFDTVLASSPTGYRNAHGTGALYSLAARWQAPRRPYFVQVRVDRHEAHDGVDANMLLVGLGVRLDQDGSFAINSAVSPDRAKRDDEIAIYGGKTIVNSFAGENARAAAIEWRHDFGPVLNGTVTFMNEGDARLIRRDGVLLQGWLEPTFKNSRFSLGAGAGAYVAVDKYQGRQKHLIPAFATTMAYRFAPQVSARLNWYRIASNDNRDSDIFLLGVGYRF